jgi:hypothetical protein
VQKGGTESEWVALPKPENINGDMYDQHWLFVWPHISILRREILGVCEREALHSFYSGFCLCAVISRH